jgi:hypothetical protein
VFGIEATGQLYPASCSEGSGLYPEEFRFAAAGQEDPS